MAESPLCAPSPDVKVLSVVEEWSAKVRMEGNGVSRLDFSGSGNLKGSVVTVDLSPTDRLEDVDSIVLRLGTKDCVYFVEKSDRGRNVAPVLGKAMSAEKKPEERLPFTITADVLVPEKGDVFVWVSLKMKSGDTVYGLPCPQGRKLMHFRIPGMVRAQDGSLVSVFDIHYDRHNDLPSNIDVGCSRSSDGGKS